MSSSLMARSLVLNFHNFAACTHSFFGIPTWYAYLKLNGSCQITKFQVPQDFLLILLALIDIGLHVAGLVATGFVIYGGFRFVTSRGDPDEAAKARWTVVNALIGLALALIAVGIVSFLGRRLG